MNLKEKWRQTLSRVRNPETDAHEREFQKQLGFKRLLFLVPFIIAVVLLWLLSHKG
jgi:hypothetical protein